MIASQHTTTSSTARAVITRGICLLVLWILIAGTSRSGLEAGVIAAALASWASLILHAPTTRRVRLAMLMWLGVRLLFNSVVAGFDVARRALDPRLPLNPGLIRYGTNLPPGSLRAAFATMMSLVPGTLPVGSTPDGALLVHCLDRKAPVTAILARDEASLRLALNNVHADD
jgi:multicomponent Na+:H+ antiporter subunit E